MNVKTNMVYCAIWYVSNALLLTIKDIYNTKLKCVRSPVHTNCCIDPFQSCFKIWGTDTFGLVQNKDDVCLDWFESIYKRQL